MEVGNVKQPNNIVFFAFHVKLFYGVWGAMSNVCCEREICSQGGTLIAFHSSLTWLRKPRMVRKRTILAERFYHWLGRRARTRVFHKLTGRTILSIPTSRPSEKVCSFRLRHYYGR